MLIRAAKRQTEPAIDTRPMIDIVFNLLLFFMIATSVYQEEREIRVALPTASSAEPISRVLREILINIDSDGRMFLGGRAIEPLELKEQVQTAVAANPQQKVTVRGDRRTAYANVVTALDICKSAGIQEPYLDTVLTDSAS